VKSNENRKVALHVQRTIFLSLTIFMSVQAMAMETLVNRPTGAARGLVVIAPAKKYLMKERLFSELAK
jgi:hypothetical protein